MGRGDAVSALSADRWAARTPVFAGAGPPGLGTPWGTLAQVAAGILGPLGFELQIEAESFGLDNTRYVADGRADFGATHLARIRASFRGELEFGDEGARDNLRVIAAVNHPSWIGVAVTVASGLTDLADLSGLGRPPRLKTGGGPMFEIVFRHHGIDLGELRAAGATFHGFTPGREVLAWARDGELDAIVDTIYAGYTPEVRHWWEASVFHDLRFLPLPDAAIAEICATVGGHPATLPRHLVRGARPVATVARLPQAYYARDDTPDDVVGLIVEAFDANRDAFRATHIPFSYDPATVAVTHGVPLHPAAERYYRERGYL